MFTCLRYLSLVFILSTVGAQAQQMGGVAAASTTTPAIKTPAATTNAAPKAPAVPVDAASQAIAEAMGSMDKNDLDGAIAHLTDAIKANPKMSGPYVFRASVYYQKKMWPEAEADFKSAAQIDPKNVVIQLNLVEIKFAQKQYDEARKGYVAIQKNADISPQMADLAAYKVFLCDLMGGHEAQAQKERDALSANQIHPLPSFYFTNAAWELAHKKPEAARSWLVSATTIFPSSKISYYLLPLKDLGFLPLPPPPAGI